MINKRNLLLAISVGGIAVSLYLTYTKLTGSPVRCGFGSCEVVQNSEYADIMGVPVSFLGIIFYLLLFALAYYNLNLYLKLWLGGGLIFSTYLTYLELFVITAICFWCVISAVLVLAAFLLAFSKFKS